MTSELPDNQPPTPAAHPAPVLRPGEAPPTGRGWIADQWSRMSLTRAQAIVGLMAGIVTVSGAIFSLVHSFGPGAGMGDVVTELRDASSDARVTDATVEILTPLNLLVATVTPDAQGRARQRVKEGIYVVRVSHPHYAALVRQVQVFSRQTVEVKANLQSGASVPFQRATKAMKDGVRAVGRAVGF
jgi:hypothetical protein